LRAGLEQFREFRGNILVLIGAFFLIPPSFSRERDTVRENCDSPLNGCGRRQAVLATWQARVGRKKDFLAS